MIIQVLMTTYLETQGQVKGVKERLDKWKKVHSMFCFCFSLSLAPTDYPWVPGI